MGACGKRDGSASGHMIIQTGDLIVLGDHLLLCGDSTQPADVQSILHGKSVQLLLTDPPYGIGYIEGKMDFAQSLGKPKAIKNDHVQSEVEYWGLREQ